MIEVLPLFGAPGYRAWVVFQRIMFGLSLTVYNDKESIDAFKDGFKEMDLGEKESYFRKALSLVEITDEEILTMLSLTKDKNGIPITASNVKSLRFDEIFERLVAVGVEIGKIKVDLVSEDEKKKLAALASISD